MKIENIDKLLASALAIEEQDAFSSGAIGYMARALTQATIPHRDPGSPQYMRQNGNLRLVITDVSGVGLPYGSIPRLVLAWMTTEAVRTKSAHIELGPSLQSFLDQMGLNRNGGKRGDITRLRDQMKRLFSAAVSWGSIGEDHDVLKRMLVSEESELWWNPKMLGQDSLWQSYVLLSPRFFEAVTDSPVPLDMRALRALKSSPLALDLYAWSTYRMSYLKRRTDIPWKALQLQFGVDYADTPQGRQGFKRKFIQALAKVHAVYPQLRLEVEQTGVQLIPSSTHVQQLNK